MIQPEGLPGARIMVVNEFPTREEMLTGVAMSGSGGYEFNRMLTEAGLSRSDCWMTYVARVNPPRGTIDGFLPKLKRDIRPDWHISHNGKWVAPVVMDGLAMLEKEITLVQPKIIVLLGNLSLWALIGEWGIKTWRGSMSHYKGIPVIPTWTPQYVLRDWQARTTAILDLQRCGKILSEGVAEEPDWKFVLRPSINQTLSVLIDLYKRAEFSHTPILISSDIETSAGWITCHGLAWSATEALCIPYVSRGSGHNGTWTREYWSAQDEGRILYHLWRLLTHPNVEVVGQNYAYDITYIWNENLFLPRLCHDTMILQHCMFPGMDKNLGFLSSLHTDTHVYWKDEGKFWNPKIDELQYWRYNAKDCCRTWEILQSQLVELPLTSLAPQYDFQMHRLWPAVQSTMRRGVTVDQSFRKNLQRDLFTRIQQYQAEIERWIGGPINISSPKQMAELFYGDYGLKPQIDKKTHSVTCNDVALTKLKKLEPLLTPVINMIQGLRSLSVLHANCALAKLDPDQHMRTSYNIAGTETFRMASSKTAYSRGMNMQNVTKGQKADPAKGLVSFPNVRSMFIPAPGMMICDSDLDRADLQVVVWEADDAGLKKALREGLDLHLYNARDIFHLPYTDDEITEGSESCEEHKHRYYSQRQKAKMGCHATNYGASPRTLATALGVTVAEAEAFIHHWFSAHPGIVEWHKRTESLLLSTHTVYNKFGYRRPFLDRVGGLLPQALAWVPQSTVACVINRVWVELEESEPLIQPLIQVHDSLVTQFLPEHKDYALRRLHEISQSIVIPYADPLIIPLGAKVSTTNWGDC